MTDIWVSSFGGIGEFDADATPPVIDTESPTGAQTSPTGIQIKVSFRDPGGSGIDQNTMQTTVNINGAGAVSALLNGAIQTGWDGPGSGISANLDNGYDAILVKTTDFDYFDSVTMTADADDDAGNSATQKIWNFTIGAVTAVSAEDGAIATDGGYALTITGTFELNRDFNVYVGTSSAGVLCYGGQGFGSKPQSSNGTTLSVVAPPVAKGLHDITVVDVDSSGEAALSNAITAYEKNFKSKNFGMRANFGPKMAVGKRKLRDEPRE